MKTFFFLAMAILKGELKPTCSYKAEIDKFFESLIYW